MSRAKPASTESASGVSVRPMPRATARPPPSSTSADGDDRHQHDAQRAAAPAGVGRRAVGRLGCVRELGRGHPRVSPAPPSTARRSADRGARVALDQRLGHEGRVLAVAPGSGNASASFVGVVAVRRAVKVMKSANCSIRWSSTRVDLQLVVPGLEADRGVEADVGREHPAGLAVDQLGERVDVGVGDLVRVVGDPHGAVLEAVHGVLVPDVDVVDGAGAVGPVAVVRTADRRRLGRSRPRWSRGPGRGRSRHASTPLDLVDRLELVGVGLVHLRPRRSR